MPGQPTPQGSPITVAVRTAAAKAAAEEHAQDEERRAQVAQQAQARLDALLGPVPGTLNVEVLDGDLVHVDDGTVHLGVRSDDTVWLLQLDAGQWAAVPPQITDPQDLAARLGETP